MANTLFAVHTVFVCKNYLILLTSRNFLSTHVRLKDKGVTCLMNCTLCTVGSENTLDLFFQCPSSLNVWTEWFTPVCEVHVGEALGLLSALEWVHQLHLGPIDFELDAKKVVNSFSSAHQDVT
ncbi:transmembrane protein, putative [Medicago truncatula]|uniref:Transmembrane protein, putative n=1 Tax=Medicago truncatula TaxID=3880 RepID=G7KW08_MEDTR|nr:transmembrane protein, putative [Medicago truncatula]